MKKYKLYYIKLGTGEMTYMVINENEKKHVDSQRGQGVQATSTIFLPNGIEVQKKDIRGSEEITEEDPIKYEKNEYPDNRTIIQRLTHWISEKNIPEPLDLALKYLDSYGEKVLEEAGKIIKNRGLFNATTEKLTEICDEIKSRFKPNTINYTKNWYLSELERLEERKLKTGLPDVRISQYRDLLKNMK